MPATIVEPFKIRPFCIDRRFAVRGGTMAGDTIAWISARAHIVAVKATHADSVASVKIDSMTQRAGILNIARGKMDRLVGAQRPILRMGVVDAVAALASMSTGTIYTDVETWIAAGTTLLTMALLA
jgi:hypothetical protein